LSMGCAELADPDDPVEFEEIVYGKLLGSGSFGAVWMGTVRGADVAIKQCKVGDASEMTMLKKEIRYLEKLRHPRLVSFLGCVTRPTLAVLLLLEYMPGGSLYDLLFKKENLFKPEARLSFTEKATMALQISEGLHYLHGVSVVHRDMKTMNIVLDEAQRNCKICDFGLTVTLEMTHLTVKSLQGSPRYMAPEQFESTARISEKVDMWQMGCVMLELFCNAIPFRNAKGVQQIATELLIKRRAPPAPENADPRARVLISACLRLSPTMRPTARNLAEALQGILKDDGPLRSSPKAQEVKDNRIVFV